MNNEARLFVEMKYGIDLSYTTFGGYLLAIVDPLPYEFLDKYGYFSEEAVTEEVLKPEFKANLINNLLDYSNE